MPIDDSTGQFLVTSAMMASLSVWEVAAFEIAMRLRSEMLRGKVEIMMDETPLGILYQWRPVRQ